jgi:hypothetical protein
MVRCLHGFVSWWMIQGMLTSILEGGKFNWGWGGDGKKSGLNSIIFVPGSGPTGSEQISAYKQNGIS